MIRVVSRHDPLDASPQRGRAGAGEAGTIEANEPNRDAAGTTDSAAGPTDCTAGPTSRAAGPSAGTGPTADAALRETALDAARLAAELHREARGSLAPDRWSEKGTSDFVTEVDREAERRIVDTITARFPSHRILAEEGTGSAGADELLWIVDPLDGTTNWLHGYPEYAVSIAALDDRGLRVGVVLDSANAEEFVATRGGGATLDGRPISVSAVSELRLALVGTGFPFKRADLLPEYLDTFATVLMRTSGVRRAGAAALDLCAVACGRLDAFWEHWLMPWDIAAGALIVREAGGSFGALPAGRGETLAAAARSARSVEAIFEGRTELPGRPGGEDGRELAGGAFMASNAKLDDAFRALLEERLAPEG